MNDTIKETVKKYWRSQINRAEFIKRIKLEVGHEKEDVRNLIEQIIANRNVDDLEYGLTILTQMEENNDMLDLVHKIILEPWHGEYEELAQNLQMRKRPESIPILKEAMQRKYKFLESYETGTRQFINQCGHALKSIGTDEAIRTIRELSTSEDPILKDEMLYRISQIEGRNDYQRNH